MSDDSEPARPPPPKSYVPITMLEGPVPTLPPRPPGTEELKLPARTPPDISPPPCSEEALLQLSAKLRTMAESSSSGGGHSNIRPIKPDRYRVRREPPLPVASYDEAVKKVADNTNMQPSSMPPPTDASRSDSMASSPMHGSVDTPMDGGVAFDRQKFRPPDFMADENIYATVKMAKTHYPAPVMPAPPPPYEGTAMMNFPKFVHDIRNTPSQRNIPFTSSTRPSLSHQVNAPPPARGPAPSRTRSATVGVSSNAATKARNAKLSQRPDIVVIGAKPIDGDALPSPPKQPPARPMLSQPPKKPSVSHSPSLSHPKAPSSASRPSPPHPCKPPFSLEKRPSPPQPKKPSSPSENRPPPLQPNTATTPPQPKRPAPPHPNELPSPQVTPILEFDGSPIGATPLQHSQACGRPRKSPSLRRPPPPKQPVKQEDVCRMGVQGERTAAAEAPPPPSSAPEPDANITFVTQGADLIKQLSELGPPPEDDPPEIPTDVQEAPLLDRDGKPMQEGTPSIDPATASLQDDATTSSVVEVPLKPPQPLRRASTKRKKKDAPNMPSPPASVTKKQESSLRHAPPSSRPPPPKSNKEPNPPSSHDCQHAEKSSSAAVGRSPRPPQSINLVEGKSDGDEREAVAEEKRENTKKVSSGSLPKKAPPVKRPPAPRTSSTRQTSSSAENLSTEIGSSNGVNGGGVEHSETEQDPVPAGNVGEASPVKKVPPVKRPPAPRTSSTRQTSSSAENQSTEIGSSSGVNGGGVEHSETEQDPVPAGNVGESSPVKKVPPVKRPPAPRTSSTRQTSSSVENQSTEIGSSNGVNGGGVEHSETEQDPVPAGNVGESSPVKKVPPVKRPPAPRTSSTCLTSSSAESQSTKIGNSHSVSGGGVELKEKEQDLVPAGNVGESAPIKKIPPVKRPPPPRHPSVVDSKADSVNSGREMEADHPNSINKLVEVHLPKKMPSVKRSPVPRPPAPKVVKKETEQRKSIVPELPMPSTTCSDPQAATSEHEVETSETDTTEKEERGEESVMVLEPKEKNKPTARFPSMRRPPPPTNLVSEGELITMAATADTTSATADSTDDVTTDDVTNADTTTATAGTTDADTTTATAGTTDADTTTATAGTTDADTTTATAGTSDVTNADTTTATQWHPTNEVENAAASTSANVLEWRPTPKERSKIHTSQLPDLLISEKLSPSPDSKQKREEEKEEETSVEVEESALDLPEPSQEKGDMESLVAAIPIDKMLSIKKPPPVPMLVSNTRISFRLQQSPEHLEVGPQSPVISHEALPVLTQASPSSLQSLTLTDKSPPNSTIPQISDSLADLDVSIQEAAGGGQSPVKTTAVPAAPSMHALSHDIDIPKNREEPKEKVGASAIKPSQPARPLTHSRTKPPAPKREVEGEIKNKNVFAPAIGLELGHNPLNSNTLVVKDHPKEMTAFRDGASSPRQSGARSSMRQPKHSASRKEEGVHILNYSDRSNSSSREPSPNMKRRMTAAGGSSKPSRPLSMPPTQLPRGSGHLGEKKPPPMEPINPRSVIPPAAASTSRTKPSKHPTPSAKAVTPKPPTPSIKHAPPKPPTPSIKHAPPKPPTPSIKHAPPKPPTPSTKHAPPKPPIPSTKQAPPKPPSPSTKHAPPRPTPSSKTKPPPPSVTSAHSPTSKSSTAPTKPQVPRMSATNQGKQEPTRPPRFPPRPVPGHPLYKYVCTEPHGIANRHHDAADDVELSYQEGDVIELIEKVDENWFYAANADLNLCEGLVQAGHLDVVKRLPGQTTVEGFEDGPCAVATNTFEGQGMDELSFKSGDLIMLKSHYGTDWFRGKLINGREGIFPKNFVEVVEELPKDAYEAPSVTSKPEPLSLLKSISNEPHCVATFSFSAEGPGELSISEGDNIELVEQVDQDWLKGRLRGQEGIFPTNFVDIIVDFPPGWKGGGGTSTSKSLASSIPVLEEHTSTALYDFDGQVGELSFKTGDKIRVTSRVSAEWVKGKLGSLEGIFPVNFVDFIPDSIPQEAEEGSSKGNEHQEELTGKCEALYEFEGDKGSDELSFLSGETIVMLEKVNDEWMKGRIGAKEGLFPVNFVKVIIEIPEARTTEAATTAQKATQEPAPNKKQPLMDDLMPKGVALSDYQSGDISFKVGDMLYLLNREPQQMIMGENIRTGDLGIFPASYVNILVPLP